MKWTGYVVWAFALLFVVNPVYANLIVNGGFEDTHVGTNKWRWFTSDRVSGWSGSNIEIWDSFQRFESFEGEQHAELNAHRKNGQAFSIFQTIETQIGEQYMISFAYAARRNNREAFSFELYANKIDRLMTKILNDHQVRQWRIFEDTFVATSNFTTLRFTTVTPYSGTVGNFLDAVQVLSLPGQTSKVGSNSSTDVPEPPTVFILLIGMVACIFSVKRTKVFE